MIDPAVLYRAACDFRWAVEKSAPFSGTFATLRAFPGGCCKQASFLLARVLDQEFAVQRMEYVWGTAVDGARGTHGWLECNGFVVDVTADQFSSVEARVVVAKRECSEFYDGFGVGVRDPYPRFWEGMKAQARMDFENTLGALLLCMRNRYR